MPFICSHDRHSAPSMLCASRSPQEHDGMTRFLIRIAFSLGAVAVALLVCSWVLPDFGLSLAGFSTAAIVSTFAQGLLGPLIFHLARKEAWAILGGVGLLSPFVALLIASLFPGGLHIRGI